MTILLALEEVNAERKNLSPLDWDTNGQLTNIKPRGSLQMGDEIVKSHI